MKYSVLLTSVISAHACAMEPVEIRDRNLDTAQKPHITIINQLPKDPGFTTRIDISDKTKITNYTKNSYRPDDSTTTIYSNRGIRFSPYLNKNGQPEHARLGMNDAGDAALITLYIHGAIRHPWINLIIGKSAKIGFGDAIIFNTNSDDAIVLNHNGQELWKLETKQKIEIISEKTKSLFEKYSRPKTTIPQPDACLPVHLIGLLDPAECGNFLQFLRENPHVTVHEMK